MWVQYWTCIEKWINWKSFFIERLWKRFSEESIKKKKFIVLGVGVIWERWEWWRTVAGWCQSFWQSDRGVAQGWFIPPCLETLLSLSTLATFKVVQKKLKEVQIINKIVYFVFFQLFQKKLAIWKWLTTNILGCLLWQLKSLTDTIRECFNKKPSSYGNSGKGWNRKKN